MASLMRRRIRKVRLGLEEAVADQVIPEVNEATDMIRF
jgi:hypothetical protein